ncbi:MAG TPA: MFS transporter [Pyrinomonadaceae bacterium]|nr:MFS transporter [Pyrinomonadaceae bacterium]
MSVKRMGRAPARAGLRPLALVPVLLGIEFLDEVLFGAQEAAWPLVRDDLQLSYTQIGLLIAAPALVGNLAEPAFAIVADVRAGWRRTMVLIGGVGFAGGTLLVGLSPSFTALLVALILINPAAGLFVSLSQVVLMDGEPARREQNMARWALAGSLGNCVGPLLLAAAVGLSLTWRWVFVVLAALAVTTLLLARRAPFPAPAPAATGDDEKPASLGTFVGGLRVALRALRRREVVRWLLLLQLGDFTWDVLRGFLALYFVDAVGVSEGRAALAVVCWTWAGLPGDALMLPLLRRVRGVVYLRVSTAIVLLLFPAFLLAEGFAAKLVLLGLLGLANAGWYAILKSRLYAELPGQSGTALALGNLFGLAATCIPLALGAFAQAYGVGAMMWLLALGPVGLLIGLLSAPAGKE